MAPLGRVLPIAAQQTNVCCEENKFLNWDTGIEIISQKKQD